MIYNRDSDIAKSQQASGLGLYFPDKIASEATLLEGQSQLGLRLYAPLHREFSVGDRKFPPNSGKFPPNSGEFAPNRQKSEPQIKAWEILWDHEEGRAPRRLRSHWSSCFWLAILARMDSAAREYHPFLG